MSDAFTLTPVDVLLSRPQASAKGLSTAGATPTEYRSFELRRGRVVEYPVYRVEDLKPKRKSVKTPAVSVDLLQAIFSVNRTAKRYRNKAAKHYAASQYGFATDAKERKQALYGLKDRGVLAAYRQGLIAATGTHGPLTYYEGGGYRFHSLLRPKGAELPVLSDETVEVEAKPKGKREARLVDAECTLAALPDVRGKHEGFERHSFPPRARERRWRDDWEDEG